MGSIVKTVGQEATKNLLWNSSMLFRQRIPAGTTALAAGYNYRLDRWALRYDATAGFTGTPTVDQNTDVPVNGLTKFSMNLAGTPSGSTAEFDVAQRMEASEARRLADKKVSFSFWVKTDSWTGATFRILTPSAEDNFASITGGISTTTKTIVANSTWQQIKVENVDMTALASCANGLEFRVEFTGATNTGAARFLRVTQVMLNTGEEVAPWNLRGENIVTELAGCQRYCALYSGPSGMPLANIGLITANTAQFFLQWPVQMRATPTITATASGWSMQTLISGANSTNGSLAAVFITSTTVILSYSGSSGGGAAGQPANILSNATTSLLIADAELL